MNCKKITLSECIEIIGGGTPKTSKKEYWGGEIPWLSVVDFNNDNRYVSKTEKTITQEGLNNCSSRLLGENDIILSARGTVGALAQLSKPMAFNQSCYGIRANELAINDYIYYLLKHSVSILKKNSYGSVFDTITRETFSRIEVLLPDLKTQKRISEVLGSLDNKIELNEKINQNLDWEDYFSICRKIIELEEENQNLEAQAQAIFKSWFVDFEPFKNGKFIDSELGNIPEGWRVGRLSDICDITMGQSPSGESLHINSDGAVFFQGRADFGSRFPKNRLYTSEPRRMAKEGSILLSVRAPVGDINIAMDSCCIGRGLASIHSRNQSFLYYLLQSLRRLFDMYNGEGTVFGAINRDSLRNIKILIPKSEIICEFERIANQIDNNIKNNELQSRRLAQLRDTLLPKLMSGEIDVSDVAV